LHAPFGSHAMQAALHGMQNILLIVDEENSDHLPHLF
jgi:hypothetical protein